MKCDPVKNWLLLALLAGLLLCFSRPVHGQDVDTPSPEPTSTQEAPSLSTTANTLRSLLVEQLSRLETRKSQAAALSTSGASIASQLSGAISSDEISSTELSLQSTATSQALTQSATASTATSSLLAEASPLSTSLSQDLTSYIEETAARLELWRTLGIVGLSVAGVEAVIIILTAIF